MMRIILSIGILLLVSGCAFWPFGFLPSWSWMASTGADAVSYVSTGKTTTDHAISAIQNEDCALFRFVKGEKICSKSNIQLVKVMYDMDCNTFIFDDLGNPSCKSD
tara:strand:- start:554 stop:871 length:318 start_codon:yes stop_codon:yes gene_type:complete